MARGRHLRVFVCAPAMPERRREEYNLACVGIGDRVRVEVKLRSWLGSRVWFTCVYVELLDAAIASRADHSEAPWPSGYEDRVPLLITVKLLILQARRGNHILTIEVAVPDGSELLHR